MARWKSDPDKVPTGNYWQDHGMKKVPWSKRKSAIENLFVPTLKLAIHCTSNKRRDFASDQFYRVVLEQETIWSFPHPFVDKESRFQALAWNDAWRYSPSALISEYIDRSRDQLFAPLEDDHWEFGDMLRAADRRIGKAKLMEWAKTLHPENPALKILEARFAVS